MTAELSGPRAVHGNMTAGCPCAESSNLAYRRLHVPVRRLDVREEPVTITAYPDGPLILRGPATVLGEDGQELLRERPTVALCRCGMTSRPPLCDGSHKLAAGRRRRDGSPLEDRPA